MRHFLIGIGLLLVAGAFLALAIYELNAAFR